jgi:signal transduction histidine kinase
MQAEPLRGRGRRSWAFDAGVTALALALGTALVGVDSPLPQWALFVVAAGLAVPLLLRRVWPTPVLAAIWLVAAGTGWWANQVAWAPALLFGIYAVAASRPRRETFAWTAVLAGSVVVATLHVVPSDITVAIPLLIALGGVTVLGLYISTRRVLLVELRERAAQLERERDQQGEIAAAAERARIAREMHDIVAHHLTVMVALSDGAAATGSTEVMRTVSATGREALADTRRLLGVLRDPSGEADRAPLPALADLGALVDRVRAAGLPVRFEEAGTPPELPAAEQLTLYRLVQEALTNTMKHGGPGAAATVTVRYEHDGTRTGVRVVVDDDGRGGSVDHEQRAPGRGLMGMRERVVAFGGEVEAGPRQPRGWRVSAWLTA